MIIDPTFVAKPFGKNLPNPDSLIIADYRFQLAVKTTACRTTVDPAFRGGELGESSQEQNSLRAPHKVEIPEGFPSQAKLAKARSYIVGWSISTTALLTDTILRAFQLAH